MKSTPWCLTAAGVAATWALAAEPVRLEGVTAERSPLAEEAAVGPYLQPEWTMARRFPTTRVYLQQAPYGMGVEQWVRSRFNKGERGTHLFQEEFELGLPHRFQVDLYENWAINEQGTTYHDSFAAELRWAPADWGKWPLNPAIYGEYKWVDQGGDVVEVKLLLGDEIAPGWHAGVNLVWEQELRGEETTEYAASAALSRTLVDRKFSAGLEAKFAEETVEGSRGDPEEKFLLGPSVQWRPTANTHLDVVPLFGVTSDAPDLEAYLVFGYDFGPGNARARAPVSLQSQ